MTKRKSATAARSLLAALAGLFAFLPCASAYDFEATDGNGSYIFYNVTSESELTCEVTYFHREDEYFIDCGYWRHTVRIPATVEREGKAYTVTAIGDSAFCRSSATVVEMPSTITKIGDLAFWHCDNMKHIDIPEGVEEIGYCAFSNCIGLETLTIPSTVRTFGERSFIGCRNLEALVVRDGVAAIGDYAFFGCGKLAAVSLPESVVSIGDGAFSSCYSLAAIGLPPSLQDIGSRAFADCSALTSITIPGAVTSIGSRAFGNCSSLASVSLPASLTYIGSYAFDGCSALERLSVPKGVDGITPYTFANAPALAELEIDPANEHYSVADGVIYDKARTRLVACLPGRGDSVLAIPPTVTSIADSAFFFCHGLREISVPKSVGAIKDSLFQGCSGLVAIELAEGIASIGVNAFEGCAALRRVNIPEGITTVSYATFLNCKSLQSVELPASVTSIGRRAFEGCESLGRVNIPEGVAAIRESAFTHSGIDSISLPASVGAIDAQAFRWCENLEYVDLPAGLRSIGDFAFQACSSLQAVQLPEGLESIGIYAFASTGLKAAVVPESVESVGSNAFDGVGEVYLYCDLADYGFLPYNIGAGAKVHAPASHHEAIRRQWSGWLDDAMALRLTVAGGGFATCCPPVAVALNEGSGIAAYKATVYDGGVSLDRIYAIAAGEGALLRSLDGGRISEDVEVATAKVSPHAGNAFVGTLDDITLPASGVGCANFVLSPAGGKPGFARADDTPLAAGTAYLRLPAAMADGDFEVAFDAAMGIGGVSAGVAGHGAYYDLSGRRVERPAKGIYIKDGKKVAVE